MTKTDADRRAAALGVTFGHVLRESWEMEVLDDLFSRPDSRGLVFKGGTALRLAHGSPRFSDDLDFVAGPAWPVDRFRALVAALAARFPALRPTDFASKRNTFLAEFQVRPGDAPTFKLKLEVSRRPLPTASARATTVLRSPVSDLLPIAPSLSLAAVWTEKLAALADRDEPRDLFDLWFIAQKLQRPVPDHARRFDRKRLRRDLCSYLPRSVWPALDDLARP